jgi:hypothetical protein
MLAAFVRETDRNHETERQKYKKMHAEQGPENCISKYN